MIVCGRDEERERARNNVQHPTYTALSELGRAVKTIFLARYLHSKALRQEIHEGLNTIERWNGANDFVYFARRGEMTSNRREDRRRRLASTAARGVRSRRVA